MSAPQAVEGSKKRKRTGKEREERKKAALEAQQNADLLLAAARGEAVAPVVQVGAADGHDAATAEPVQGVVPPAEQDAAEGSAGQVEKKGPDVDAIAKRIPQALKSLHPLFKKAKAFESTRLIKKIKFIKGKEPKSVELADLEAQLQEMHHVPLHDIAQSHLRIKLSKHHHFKHSPIPPALSAPLTASGTASSSASIIGTSVAGTAAVALRTKVENRLVSNKTVADGVKGVLAWVIGEEGAKLGGAGKAKSAAAALSLSKGAEVGDDDDDEEEEEEDDEMDIHRGPGAHVQAVGEGEDDEDEIDEEDRAADAAGWESGSLGGDEEEEDDGDEDDADSDADSGVIEWSEAERYSGPEDENSENESGEDEDDEDGEDAEDDGAETDGSSSFIAGPPPKRSKTQSTSKPATVTASSSKVKAAEKPKSSEKAKDRVKAEAQRVPEPKSAKATKASKAALTAPAKVDKNITSSLFLPSLAVGFAAGGDSDSDPDLDADVDGSGIIGKKGVRERKNRRGQRARQAIWEKKYGKNAKHVIKNNEMDKKKAEEQVVSATKNAYARRAQVASTAGGAGATATAASTGAGASRPAYGSGGGVPSAPAARNAAASGVAEAEKPKPAAAQALHPSWAAAKMRQKQLAEGPKATKIVFD